MYGQYVVFMGVCLYIDIITYTFMFIYVHMMVMTDRHHWVFEHSRIHGQRTGEPASPRPRSVQQIQWICGKRQMYTHLS